MVDEFTPYLEQALNGQTLTSDQSQIAFAYIMDGDVDDLRIAAFLAALRTQGESVDTLLGLVQLLLRLAPKIKAPDGAIDTCGTGGDGKGSFNISTAAAFVVAGCGVLVAKHGNRAQSSKSGSADVLEALGVRLSGDLQMLQNCWEQAGIAFLLAPLYHKAMARVGPVRKALKVRTIFNLVGPLVNPARVSRQLIGVFAKDWLEPMARVLQCLGVEKAWVVCGVDGMDEVSLSGPTDVVELDHGQINSFSLSPEDAGISTSQASLSGGDGAKNAALMKALLDGNDVGAIYDGVVLNAAAALCVAGAAKTLKEGAAMAKSSLDDGRAADSLSNMITASQGGNTAKGGGR